MLFQKMLLLLSERGYIFRKEIFLIEEKPVLLENETVPRFTSCYGTN